MIKKVNEKKFSAELANNKHVVCKFFATWCGPCKMTAPIFEEVSEEIKNVAFLEVNIDEEEELTKQNKVEVLPTIIAYENGKAKEIITGFRGKTDIIAFVKRNSQ